jgi:hypothetical protein
MYLLLRKEKSCHGTEIFHSYFTEDTLAVSDALKEHKDSCRIYKLDNLHEIQSIEVSFKESILPPVA